MSELHPHRPEPEFFSPAGAPLPPSPPSPPRPPSRLPLLLGILLGLSGGYILLDTLRGSNWLRGNGEPRAITPRADLANFEKSTIDIFEGTSPSVVFITRHGNRKERRGFRTLSVPDRGAGSGFVWDKAGHIVTNYHVVQGADQIKVTLADRTTWNAKPVGGAADKDIAVIRIEAEPFRLTPIPLGTSDDLRVGQSVFAIGNPFGLDQTLTTGVVSATGRMIPSINGRTIEDVIQTDAAINPGNSGGPLLDSAGRLIGVNTQIVSESGSSSGIGFAIPVDTVNLVVPQLVEHGQVVRPQLGIVILDDMKRRQAGLKGVVIRSVQPGSGADEAGLRGFYYNDDGVLVPGDTILKIAGESVNSLDELLNRLERYKGGDSVTVEFQRAGEVREVDVVLQAPED